MAEPILDASRVVARIGQRIAADMPQHVGVDRKGEAGTRTMRLISRLTASGVNGPPHSVANTKGRGT